MRSALRVVQPGLQTTVQDLGRTGHQRLGIPVSGALDMVALRAANIVAGNRQEMAGLEIALLGPTLEVEADSVRVALAGGRAEMEITRVSGETERVRPLQSVHLLRGDRVRVGTIGDSAVAYLAIEGGLELAPFMGSLSTYVRGGFGGFEGRALRPGDRLGLSKAAVEVRPELRLEGLALEGLALGVPSEVRVVLGPQADYFTSDATVTFLDTPYAVSREADRMGLRLEGQVLAHAKGSNIVSDGIAPGAIQVPGSGQPIVLLADRQTTGGYPKIATVISADLPALGRVKPGAVIRFKAVSVAEAQAARRALEAEINGLAGRRVVVRAQGLDVEQLYAANLVSGVVDGHLGE